LIIYRYSAILPEEIFKIYIPGASLSVSPILMVFPAPAEINFWVFRIRSPVIEKRLIPILPDRLESNDIVKESLNGFG
jgi:hypothetical protein